MILEFLTSIKTLQFIQVCWYMVFTQPTIELSRRTAGTIKIPTIDRYIPVMIE